MLFGRRITARTLSFLPSFIFTFFDIRTFTVRMEFSHTSPELWTREGEYASLSTTTDGYLVERKAVIYRKYTFSGFH